MPLCKVICSKRRACSFQVVSDDTDEEEPLGLLLEVVELDEDELSILKLHLEISKLGIFYPFFFYKTM
jgi:hypothetical protein